MSIKIVRSKTNDFEKLFKHLRELSNKSVKVGYFKDQGKHASGAYYATIMQIHEDGLGNNPSRPVLTIGSLELENGSSPEFNQAVIRTIVGVNTLDTTLPQVGEAAKEHIQSVFGDAVKLSPVTNNPTPLVDTGELKDNLTFKVE